MATPFVKVLPGCLHHRVNLAMDFAWRWFQRACWFGGLLVGMGTTTTHVGAQDVDFDRDIRPILADRCFKCHGPDESQRQADLRLDIESAAVAPRDEGPAIVPGQVAASNAWRRLTSTDPARRMPPPDSGPELTRDQLDLLRRWIDQGAAWQQHWAFVPPQPQPLPVVVDTAWPRNGIDAFVLARLKAAGLKPTEEADRATLMRRVSLDLTGLPPTPQAVDAFLADPSPRAYEALVDRLLQSPEYGERMAVVWLDAARYADTSGYQNDGPRDMWRWRDWVIDAYNHGMAFDQFTIEQLAGDLLPNPTLEQRIATGFNRNHRGNAEGGVIPEEFQVEYVVDRVETTGTVWLGLTVGCCRCHDHKFDPISQREFYRLFAFFNNVPEFGRAIKEGNSPPVVVAPTAEQQRRLRRLDRQLAAAENACARLEPALRKAQLQWEQAPRLAPGDQDWAPAEGLVAHYRFDGQVPAPPAGDDQRSPVPSPFQVVGDDPAYGDGRLQGTLQLDGRQFVDAHDVANFGYTDRFTIAAWIRPDELRQGTVWSRMTDAEQADGYYVQLRNGHVQVNLVKRWLDDCIRVETVDPIEPAAWTHLAVTYDGTRVAAGIGVYVNGRRVPLKTNYDFINQSFASAEPFRIGGGGGPNGRFVGRIDEVRVYDRCLSRDEVAIVSTPETIGAILEVPAAERSPNQARKLAAGYLDRYAPARIRAAHRKLAKIRRQRRQLADQLPTVMVMAEMAKPRVTHVLLRGEYDNRGEQVKAGVPRVLPELPAGRAPVDRLALAEWIVDGANPLTARVAMNRYWQMHFGTGLVKTAEDFGTQGERPSHPRLLDWLATEFVRSGWDIKEMQRRIVTSATYRQSSRVTPERRARDPENRLLSRGARFRLPAEMVRDQGLAAGGILVRRIGGPSVKPYQPADLWRDIASDNQYVQSEGADLYRRSMYTYWKRTVVPPTMAVFDGAGREMCQVRGERTNTPLQALTLLNDVTFVEAARLIAERAVREAKTPVDRLRHMYRLVLVAPPSEAQLAILVGGFERQLDRFRATPGLAGQWLSAGDSPPSTECSPSELAAYATMASLLLNLDSAVMHQ